jgi:hypothetical protein
MDHQEFFITALDCLLIQNLILNARTRRMLLEESCHCYLCQECSDNDKRVNKENLATLVASTNYKGVIQHLKEDEESANEGLDMIIANITGLEEGVMRQDWKMVAIFFSFGAHPKFNCFSGTLDAVFQSLDETLTMGYIRLCEPTPGYHGLRQLLVEEEDEGYGEAYLSILETLHNPEKFQIHNDLHDVINHLDVVHKDLCYSSEQCMEYVKAILLSMTAMGLPSEVGAVIAQDALLGTFHDLVYNHAMRGIETDEFVCHYLEK